MKKAMIALTFISSFAWFAPTTASACQAGGGSAIGCGIKCMKETSPFLKAVCAIMAPNPNAK